MHAVPVKHRAPTLSHYCPNAYAGISDTNSSVMITPIRDSTLTNSQKTLLGKGLPA